MASSSPRSASSPGLCLARWTAVGVPMIFVEMNPPTSNDHSVDERHKVDRPGQLQPRRGAVPQLHLRDLSRLVKLRMSADVLDVGRHRLHPRRFQSRPTRDGLAPLEPGSASGSGRRRRTSWIPPSTTTLSESAEDIFVPNGLRDVSWQTLARESPRRGMRRCTGRNVSHIFLWEARGARAGRNG